MTAASSVWQLAAEHFFSFGFGALVGFYLSTRYRLIRRNGNGNGKGCG